MQRTGWPLSSRNRLAALCVALALLERAAATQVALHDEDDDDNYIVEHGGALKTIAIVIAAIAVAVLFFAIGFFVGRSTRRVAMATPAEQESGLVQGQSRPLATSSSFSATAAARAPLSSRAPEVRFGQQFRTPAPRAQPSESEKQAPGQSASTVFPQRQRVSAFAGLGEKRVNFGTPKPVGVPWTRK